MQTITITAEQLQEHLNWLLEHHLGVGDLTTEVLSPYERFHRFEVYSLQEQPFPDPEPFVKWLSSFKQVNLLSIQKPFVDLKPGESVITVEGNSRLLIPLLGLLSFLLSRQSSIISRVNYLRQRLEETNLKLLQSSCYEPCYLLIDLYAFQQAGGLVTRTTPDNHLYIKPIHLQCLDDLSLLNDRIASELGTKNHRLQVEIEINQPEYLHQIDIRELALVHLVGIEIEKIKEIIRESQFPERFVPHLESEKQLSQISDLEGLRFLALETLFSHPSQTAYESRSIT